MICRNCRTKECGNNIFCSNNCKDEWFIDDIK